jgi:hypothetical protein
MGEMRGNGRGRRKHEHAALPPSPPPPPTTSSLPAPTLGSTRRLLRRSAPSCATFPHSPRTSSTPPGSPSLTPRGCASTWRAPSCSGERGMRGVEDGGVWEVEGKVVDTSYSHPTSSVTPTHNFSSILPTSAAWSGPLAAAAPPTSTGSASMPSSGLQWRARCQTTRAPRGRSESESLELLGETQGR